MGASLLTAQGNTDKVELRLTALMSITIRYPVRTAP